MTPATTRKLGLGHFAYLRAIVQGLDTAACWERYLAIEGQSSDARLVRSTTAWIRAELVRASLRADRHGVARLMKLEVQRLGRPDPQLPSLDQFAEEHGLEDSSQAEQLAAYAEHHGQTTRRQQRRQRLIARQLDALRWLELQVAQTPQPGDAVRAWFAPHLAGHLEAVGLLFLGQLVERVNGIGRHWWAGIPAIGATKAARLVAWLRLHGSSLGLPPGPHIDTPRQALDTAARQAVVTAATAVRPLDKLVVPAELDGRAGLYRRPQAQCLLAADNDLAAVNAWIASKTAQSHTQRAYRKEAERFVLWAIVQRGKPLSSMQQEDCVAYRDFLADPGPRARWCGPRSHPRWSPAWRPFEGPLSTTAQRYALTVLKNLYGFLVDQNYLMGNPWRSISVPRSAAPRLQTGRSLSPAQWRWVEQQADALESTSTHRRLRVALRLLYRTGLRLSEVVAARAGDLSWVEYPAEGDDPAEQGWMLQVVGKGHKLREVPVPEAVVDELNDYLASRGCKADVQHADNQDTHLLGKASDWAERAPGLASRIEMSPADGIAGTTLYEQLKAFFGTCAMQLRAQGDIKGAQRLERASTHWLRHSHASHMIAQGLPVEIVQQNLGHASLATTTLYVTTEQRRRLQASKKAWGG
ncbi:MAG: hypothetical protein RLZZ373_233 [Pseudomonadota bacterium]